MVVHVSDLVSYADYVLVVSGSSPPHLDAIAGACVKEAKARGVRPVAVEGSGSSGWILVDLGDVVLHVFHPEERGYYDIEGMWVDAPRVEIPGIDPRPPGSWFVAR